MDSNVFLSYVIQIGYIAGLLLAVVGLVRLFAGVLRDVWGVVVDTPIIPKEVSAVDGSLKDMACAATRRTSKGVKALFNVLKGKAKAKKGAKAVVVNKYSLWS